MRCPCQVGEGLLVWSQHIDGSTWYKFCGLFCKAYVSQAAPFSAQIEACNQEAIKLSTFINNRTPLMASDPVLSHLVAAFVNTSQIEPVQVSTEPIVQVTYQSPDYLNSGSQVSISIVIVTLLSLANVFFCALR